MGFFNKILGTGKVADEPLEKQRHDLLSNPMVTMGIWKVEEGCDEIPGFQGAFGLTESNPIPVNGIVGEICYINRLRSKTGVGFFYHRLGSVSNPVNQSPVDKFEIVAVDASEWLILYLSPYYLRRSIKTPTGLTLFSWDNMNDFQRTVSKLNVTGSTEFVNNFPIDLPNKVLHDAKLNSISPGLGQAMAKRINEMLSMQAGKWGRSHDTILVVEDDDTMRDFIVQFLLDKQPSLSIETASDGVEALDKIAERIPSILITNLNMPRMDGITLLKTLYERGINLPTLATSGWWTQEAFKKELAEKGVASEKLIVFLQKPFQFEELGALVEKLRQGGPIAG